MSKLAVNGIEIYYEVYGAGKPLLLIPGLGSDTNSWAAVVGPLSKKRQVIMMDNRCAGRTTPVDVETSVPQMANDCAALLNHLNIESADVVGHSMGGFVALEMAINHSALVSDLVLVTSGACNSVRNNELFLKWADDFDRGDDPEGWFKAVFDWMFTKKFMAQTEVIDAAIKLSIEYEYGQAPAAFRKQVNAIVEYDCRAKLSEIKARAHSIYGEEDELFPPDTLLSEQIPNCSHEVIPAVSHSIQSENPAAFTASVLNFLESAK